MILVKKRYISSKRRCKRTGQKYPPPPTIEFQNKYINRVCQWKAPNLSVLVKCLLPRCYCTHASIACGMAESKMSIGLYVFIF